MAECMAEIEKGADAALALVGGDSCGLCLTAFHDGMDACFDIACFQAVEIGFEPVEEIAVADQPVFHDFRIACEKFAHRQRFKGICIGEDEAGLVEGTRLNSSHVRISYAVFCLKKKNKTKTISHYDDHE